MATPTPYITYAGNNIKTVFDFPFLILSPGDITVWLTLAGNDYDEVGDIITNYSVSINPSPTIGGSITIEVAPPTGSTLTIRRTMSEDLQSDFSSVQAITGERLDELFTQISLVLQQIDFSATTGLHYPINAAGLSAETTTVPVLAEGQVWKKVGSSVAAVTIEENPDISSLRSELESSTSGSAGANIVGAYDSTNAEAKTVEAYLNELSQRIATVEQASLPAGTVVHSYASLGSGWLELDDLTIGNTGSGAEHTGNAFEQLFTVIWENIAQYNCSVRDSQGELVDRGASAAADWSDNRQIDLPKTINRSLRIGTSNLNAYALQKNETRFTTNFSAQPTDIAITNGGVTDSTSRFANGMAVTLTSTGTLPAPLTTGTSYRVLIVSDSIISLSTSVDNMSSGVKITFTSNGVGTHTIHSPSIVEENQGQRFGASEIVQTGSQVGGHVHPLGTTVPVPDVAGAAVFSPGSGMNTGSLTGIQAMGIMNPANVCRGFIKL